MTQQDKELLLKDLCTRLPYGVKCKWVFESYTGGGVLCDIDHVKTSNGYRYWDCYFEDEGDDIPIELVKPYLRPMSSMTEEEEDLLSEFNCYYINGELFFSCSHSQEDIYNAIDWLNAHQFDYRGLIEKGLALEAPEGMYNLEDK